MKVKLADVDRERLGCPDELDCTPSLSVREAEAVEDATGMDALAALLAMQPEKRSIGEGKVRYRLRPQSMRLLVWLGLHRAGVSVAYADLDFDFSPFLGWHWEEEDEPGKEPSPEGESNTGSKSARSGRSTASKTSRRST